MFIFSKILSKVSEILPKTYDAVRKADKVLFVERTKDLNEGLLYSDFSLKSLIDADAIDLLQPFSPLSASRLSALDSSAAAIDSLSGIVDKLPVDSEISK